MKKYEYKKVHYTQIMDSFNTIMINRLNDFGSEGWELVEFSYVDNKISFAYFKRELPKAK